MLKSLYFVFETIKEDVRNYNELEIFLFLGYKDYNLFLISYLVRYEALPKKRYKYFYRQFLKN